MNFLCTRLGPLLLLGGSLAIPERAADADEFKAQIVIHRGGGGWKEQQVQEPVVLPNPKDPSRLIMFYAAQGKFPRSLGVIGKAWALASEPYVWHEETANPIFWSGQDWDSSSVRLDTVLYLPEEDSYYIYYTGTSPKRKDQIGLAIVAAGADGYSGITAAAIRRHGEPVLSPEPAAPYFENVVSQSAVLREWDEAAQRWQWYMYYSYRGKDGILPGLRLATSTDGKAWIRHFNENDPRKMGQIFESTPRAYYEWHQIFKVGPAYVLSMEVGLSRGERWRAVLATSVSPDKGWRSLPADTLLQTKWAGVYDDSTIYHLATPAFYQIKGKWHLFAQACGRPKSGNYIDGAWEMWAIPCTQKLPILGGQELMVPAGSSAEPQ
jgi:hypothetical protein